MNQYINSEKFLAWYRDTARTASSSDQQILDEVFRQYCDTRRASFELTGAQTKSGQPAFYPFDFEHLNSCVTDKVIITF